MLKLALLTVVCTLITAFFFFDLKQYTNIDFLKENQTRLAEYYQSHALLMMLIYGLTYVLQSALSLPGAAVLTLAAGALFGFTAGLIVASFASSIGATAAFLVSRTLMRDFVQNKFGNLLTPINQGIVSEGAFYLFSLRLVPVFPFFVVNLLMGLTPIRTFTFYWVSQIGMLAGTAVFVNAGTQLARIQEINDILSPEVVLSFALLGAFPLFIKKLLGLLQHRFRRLSRHV